MLPNIPESRWARSWMSLILSLMSVIPSRIWSDSDFRTGLDWSMIVHSDSWTFFSSESQDPTGPEVGRSFMLKCDKIFDNFHHLVWSIYNVWTSNLYLRSSAAQWWSATGCTLHILHNPITVPCWDTQRKRYIGIADPVQCEIKRRSLQTWPAVKPAQFCPRGLSFVESVLDI